MKKSATDHSATIRAVTPADAKAIAALHADVFGPGRFARSAYRVREGKGDRSRFCRAAFDASNGCIAALRLTDISIGGIAGAALLGPLAVANGHTGHGIGTALINAALQSMTDAGVRVVILVGDLPYYGRFGFKPVPPGQIAFPGPVNPERILALELQAGALADYRGLVAASAPSADAGNG
ncbi:MAG: GNAT family N-acetyltransferase [Hyphomicrobium sp.]